MRTIERVGQICKSTIRFVQNLVCYNRGSCARLEVVRKDFVEGELVPKLSFGTDGIRGKVGEFPFTQDVLRLLGQAIASWAVKKYEKQAPRVLLGHDTRVSCKDIKNNLSKGLRTAGLVIKDGGVLPTPAVLQVIKSDKNFDFGIVISASHNPYTDNGVKLFDCKTGKLTLEDEQIIVENFEKNKELLETVGDEVELWAHAQEIYKKNILKNFKPNFLYKKKIVLDCANGATYKVAPEIFRALGAEVMAVSIEPDGKNINEKCGALYPENMKKFISKDSVGFAFDGDGDRVIAVNGSGDVKDGDDLLSILLQHDDFKSEEEVAGTIMTNYGFENFLKKQGKRLARTKVGDKYVAAYLEKKNLILGGETSGHIIVRDYLSTGDGIFVALKSLESMIEKDNWAINTFKKTPQAMLNIPVSKKRDLSESPYADIIDEHKAKLINGRIVVRYSGTENLLRIMVEDQTDESAGRIASSLGHNLEGLL